MPFVFRLTSNIIKKRTLSPILYNRYGRTHADKQFRVTGKRPKVRYFFKGVLCAAGVRVKHVVCFAKGSFLSKFLFR